MPRWWTMGSPVLWLFRRREGFGEGAGSGTRSLQFLRIAQQAIRLSLAMKGACASFLGTVPRSASCLGSVALTCRLGLVHFTFPLSELYFLFGACCSFWFIKDLMLNTISFWTVSKQEA